jgi:hypothetical protein
VGEVVFYKEEVVNRKEEGTVSDIAVDIAAGTAGDTGGTPADR